MGFLKKIDSCFLIYCIINTFAAFIIFTEENGKSFNSKIKDVLLFLVVSILIIIFCKIFNKFSNYEGNNKKNKE